MLQECYKEGFQPCRIEHACLEILSCSVGCRSHDVDATEVRERAAFWGALCKLLLLMPSPEPSLPREALPEDWQLRAFGPLNAAHQHLHFQLPRTEKVLPCPERVRSLAFQLQFLMSGIFPRS